jgi:hypothetical protein
MAAGDDYLFRAAELLAKAECESDAKKRSELENLGWAFLRLAGQARRNRATDIVYEPPPPKLDELAHARVCAEKFLGKKS